MRVWLSAALVFCLGWLLPAAASPANAAGYTACSGQLQSANAAWLSIAIRICTSLKMAASLSARRDTEEGKKGIHLLYVDTFDVDALMKRVTPQCIRQWGVLNRQQIAEIIEKDVYKKIADFVLDRPEEFKSEVGAGLQIGPFGRKPGQLLSRIVSPGQQDIEIIWDFVCAQDQCRILDITVYGASLSDQVKASLQSRCHR